MIGDFLNAAHKTFKPSKIINHKFQAYFELVNQQRTTDNEFLTDNR